MREISLFKKWIEEHFKLFGILLLVLAGLNAWVASEIFPDHPIIAMANGAMAVALVLGVLLSWKTGGAR
jgi:uncharacterized membrane protein (DUF441 family)